MTYTGKPLGHSSACAIGYQLDAVPDVQLENPWSVGVIHDLGNLIQVASSAVSLIARRSGVGDAEDVQTLVAGARSALDRASVIVRQSITCALQKESALEHVNVTACLAEIGNMTRHMWNEWTRLDISTRSDSLAVTCSGLGLQNAVLNLILNARDAMPDGGAVVVLATELPNGRGGSDIEIQVVDTGVGMTREVIERAFVPYFTTKSNGAGGVGLPAVKRFVEDAGGTIEIQSRPSLGTSVILRLPAATALSAALASALAGTAQPSFADQQSGPPGHR